MYTNTMKRALFCFLFGCMVITSFAQENSAKVKENAFLLQKEIEIWRTDQSASPKVKVYSCQAVRLDANWFLTAAHCVYNTCSGSLPCTIQITLAEASLRQQVRISHSTQTPRVFIYPGFYPGQNRISSVDVALIRLDPSSADYDYAALEEGIWQSVTPEQFKKQLKLDPETKAQLAAKGALLVSSANLPNSRLLPRIVVPKMQNGSLSYLVSPSLEVYFVSKLQHFISPSFGVRRGNSGGGVFTTTGDLVGLVSSLLYAPDGSASFQDDEGKTMLTLSNAHGYFLFTGFNSSTLNFIRNHVPNLRTVSAEGGFATPTEKDFQSIVRSINRTPMSF